MPARKRTSLALSSEQLLQLYEDMSMLRAFDEKVSERCIRGEIPGLIHLGVGEEAVAVGVNAALQPQDKMVSTHRAHSHFLARGADPKAFMAELYGKATGCCGGKAGSMHLADLDIGFLAANGVVGGGLPLAVGAALGLRILNDDGVTLCFFGDGANNNGAFHESLNLAAVLELPVVFLCENNGYGISQSIHKQQRVANVADRAPGYGIPAEIIDGNDVLEVYETVRRAVDKARAGGGPTLIEAKTYRTIGHYVGDSENYRSAEEVAEWQAKDPIVRFEQVMRRKKLLNKALKEEIAARIAVLVEEATDFALHSPFPDPASALSHVYAEGVA